MKVAIYSIHSDYKKLSVDFEKLKNIVTECLQNDSLNSHGTDIFDMIMDIDYHLDRIYVPLNDAYNDIFIRSKKIMKKLYDIILFICSIALCVSALWLIAIEITDTPDVYMSYETKVCRKVIIYDGPNEIRGSCKKLPKKYNIVWVK